MPRKLSKSIEEYVKAGGWSSKLFFKHAKEIFLDFEVASQCTFEIGRHVMYIRSKGKMLKAYVHYNGRTKEYMTFTDDKGGELVTFHHTIDTEEIKGFILEYFKS